MRILLLDSSNLCRSPIAERLLAVWTAEHLKPLQAARLHISSAGLGARPDSALDQRTVKLLSRLAADQPEIHTCPFEPRLAEEADLILTMDRADRATLLCLVPRVLRRAFTLAEAASLVREADLSGFPELPISARAAELAVRLHAARPTHRASVADDLPDPGGHRLAVHKSVARQIEAALRPLSDVLLIEGPGLSRPARRAAEDRYEVDGTPVAQLPDSATAARAVSKKREPVRSHDVHR